MNTGDVMGTGGSIVSFRKRGLKFSGKTVRKLMQQLGLKSPVRLKKYRSYRGNMGLAAENILQRQFKAEAPCEKWVTDITEFRAGGQKLYLSPILDLFNGESWRGKLPAGLQRSW
ncbi:hypothetical protein MY012_27020 [Escherichia coli]|nr:hypothetical protein MY012_27020 [Escherichia coli]